MIIMIGIITDTDEKKSMLQQLFILSLLHLMVFFIPDELDHSSDTWMHQLR